MGHTLDKCRTFPFYQRTALADIEAKKRANDAKAMSVNTHTNQFPQAPMRMAPQDVQPYIPAYSQPSYAQASGN
jgi:hypothetical protein